MNEIEKTNDHELVAAAVEDARRYGAELAEAFFYQSDELVIEVRNGDVENLKIARESGIGIRLINNGHLGFAFTSDLRRDSLRETVRQAIANARIGSPDPNYLLPAPPEAYPEMELVDYRLKEVPLEEKIKLAQEIERSGRGYDSRVRLTEEACYQEEHYRVTLANSLGILASFEGSLCGGYASLVAGDDGDQQTGFGLSFTRKFDELDPAAIGREAAFKAVRMLGARRLETRRTAVVFDPYVVTSFLGLIASALSADAVQKGRSLFAGRVGEKVAAEGVTIVDDGTIPKGLMSSPFDGEGVPSQRTSLIVNGRLEGFLHNTYTGAKDGVPSTGNAARSSYRSTPEVGTTNFYLAPGGNDPQEIIKSTENGFYLTEVMGMHTANPVSGDFSVGAAGIWIEHGELTTPVRGMVIAGNILELLEKIDMVGNDLRFFIGTGAPTIRVAGLTVSGQ